MGRPSLFTPDIANAICERIASGESLRSVCRDEAMPSEAGVRRWALDDVNGFSAQYSRARELQAHAIADEMLEIADDGSNDWMVRAGKDGSPGFELNGEHVQRSRARLDTRKWLLSKMLPKVYGDKITQEHQGANGGPVEFVIYGEREAKDADVWQQDNPPPA